MSELPLPPARLSPAIPADIPSLAHIHVIACATDLAVRLKFPHERDFEAYITQMLSVQVGKPEWLIIKAEDIDSGNIIAWGSWELRNYGIRETDNEDDGVMQKKVEEGSAKDNNMTSQNEAFPIPSGLRTHVREHSRLVLADWMGTRKHMLLNGLFTSPTFQRRGVGTALIRLGNERADVDNVPSFCQGSPFAHGLYRKMGWVDVGWLDVDLKEWVEGGQDGHRGWGIYRFWYMVRY